MKWPFVLRSTYEKLETHSNAVIEHYHTITERFLDNNSRDLETRIKDEKTIRELRAELRKYDRNRDPITERYVK